MRPLFFESPADFRKWLESNHATATELLVGFYKRDSGRPSITWPESVDQALCFGWIDGVRKRIDDESYTIRFTPRRRGSTWSTINIRRAGELRRHGLMQPAGEHAFQNRIEEKSSVYSYEKAPPKLDPAQEKRFRANRKAWKWFTGQAPSYQRVAIHWVTSAKKEETQQRRLAQLIDDSANERRLGVYTLKPAER